MEKDKAKILYFTLQDEQTKDEKLDWFANTKIEQIPFERITPDKKANWVNQTDNDFDDLLPLVDKEVKAGRSEEAVFKIFSTGLKTKKDEWIYDVSKNNLVSKIRFFIEIYQRVLNSEKLADVKNQIKWDRELENYLERKITKEFNSSQIIDACYRPFSKQYLYFDKHFNSMILQWFNIYKTGELNKFISFVASSNSKSFHCLAASSIVDVHFTGDSQCLPLYRFDANGDRVGNITDWALEKFRDRYLSTQARGLSPLFPTGGSVEEARGLSPLFSTGGSVEEARGLSPLFSTGGSVEEARGLSPLFPTGGSVEEARGLSPLFPTSGSVEEARGLSPLLLDKQLWFVTFVTHNSRISERMVTYGLTVGEPLIFSAEDQIFIAEKIVEATKRYETAIAALNVLPDHVHMVIAAETEKELTEKIRKIKGFSSHEFQRSRNWDKGQQVWAQKFNRQPIEDEDALTNILDYVSNNHIKHSERWGKELISTWENGIPEKGLRPICEIVQHTSTEITRGLSPLPPTDSTEITRGLSPLPPTDSTERTRGLSPLPPTDSIEITRGLSPLPPTTDSTEITRGLSPLPPTDSTERTRGLSPLPPTTDSTEITRGLSPLPPTDSTEITRGLSPLPEPDKTITKLDIFHYTYAVIHHPAYRTKYELNLKREFPRLPFYEDFHQWAAWGRSLMDLHLNYETVEPYGLQQIEIDNKANPKAKLKADKTNGAIALDDNTQLTGVPAIAWEYKLGNRSALEWILDQYKEKKPKDPTIAKLFNNYKFSDYKTQVIVLTLTVQRVCTVSVRTMKIIEQMP